MPNKEFAPGLPSRDISSDPPEIKTPESWIYNEQRHFARRAGEHIDLRLSRPRDGISYSWVVHDIPKPGESVLAIKQPDHTISYATQFEGIIEKGYGAGKVEMKKGPVPMEVITSRPNGLTFSVYDKRLPEDFYLFRWEKGGPNSWLLRNFTPTGDKYPIGERKKYESLDIDKIDVSDPNMFLSPKYDGASSEIHLIPGKRPRVLSTRKPKIGDVIDHSAKFPELLSFRVPREIGPVVLAGEILALNKKGRFAGANITAGILNSETLKAREKAGSVGSIENFIFDIVRGLKADAPYEEKLDFIRYISSIVPKMRPAEVAATQKDKADLIKRIVSGKHPHSKEGLVSAIRQDSGIKLIKHKILKDVDVYVRDVVPGTGRLKDSAGAILYSHKPGGPVVGKVGSGFSDRARDLIWKRREDLKGAVISLKSMGEYSKTGALRAPVFLRLHPDKNPTVASGLIEELA